MIIDPVRRLAVIAAAIHEATLVETVLNAPYAAVWTLAGDLERGVPQFEPSVVAIQILQRDGERLRIVAHTPTGRQISMGVVLRDGYCLMQSANVSIGMAARAERDKTRFAHFEAVPGRAMRQEKLIAELQTLEQLARAGG